MSYLPFRSLHGVRFFDPRLFAVFLLSLNLGLSACGDDEEAADTSAPATETADGEGKQDYLTADLRADVEKLKTEVAKTPTDEKNVAWRNQVVWKWLNAWAMDNRYVPANAPFYVLGNSIMPKGMNFNHMHGHHMLDQTVRELTMLEDAPDALGPIVISKKGPYRAHSYVTFTQTYTTGSRPVEVNGGFLLGAQWAGDQGTYQATDPAKPNYVSVKSSNPAVRFRATGAPFGGMYGGFYGPKDVLFFQVTGAALQPGDKVTFTYGDRSGGSPGFQVQSHSNDWDPFPVFVDLTGEIRPELNGDREFFGLAPNAIQVVGGPVTGVHGFGPSVVATGEKFDFSIRAEDKFVNRATGNIPAFDLLANGKIIKSIPAGKKGVTLIKGLSFDKPGIYRFTIRSADGRIEGGANPLLVENKPDMRVYWGETHGHSGMSEGQGSETGYYRYARDDARLDFVTHSEHDIWVDDREWASMQKAVRDFYKEGEFITFLGYEWSEILQMGGHHNVLFRTPEERLRVPAQEAPTLTQLYQNLRNQNKTEDVLIIPHAHEPGDWRRNDPQMETLVEIMSEHGTFEWFGQKYLAAGAEVGFVAASDDHFGHPGYGIPRSFGGLQQMSGLAAVLAPAKTGDNIFNALKARSTYADTGQRIILLAKVNDTLMGGRAAFNTKRVIAGRAIGAGPIKSVTIVRDGQDIWTKEYATATEGPSSLYHVEFETSSEPMYGARAQPRGWRPWVGSLKVTGARIVKASLAGFVNPRKARLKISDTDASVVEFLTETRGARSAVVLELADVTSALSVSLNIKEATEEGYTPSPLAAKAGVTPAATLTFAASDLKGGIVEKRLPSGDYYSDAIRLRRVKSDAPKDVTFSYTDTDRFKAGEYYYVRVEQLDGARAWSSPVWVGGNPPM